MEVLEGFRRPQEASGEGLGGPKWLQRGKEGTQGDLGILENFGGI